LVKGRPVIQRLMVIWDSAIAEPYDHASRQITKSPTHHSTSYLMTVPTVDGPDSGITPDKVEPFS
jgi:hypothetical protein